MVKPAILCDQVSKRYAFRSAERYITLREKLAGLFSPRRPGAAVKSFLALDEVSLQVERGTTVGIIGDNGAGKSTLLKILSRITPPSAGRVEICGRVGSLLEVGTGFHPELSGRENIYLNGAILGMDRADIEEKFDEIVAFSGVGEFLGLAVKNYSTGMYMRLAFAVAAHLRTEILLLDEALAVGDAMFTNKCIRRIGEIAQAGRTVVLVSHNMKAVESLCSRVIWLERGKIAADGSPRDVIPRYLERSNHESNLREIEKKIEGLPEDPDFRLLALRLTQNGKVSQSISSALPMEIHIEYRIKRPLSTFRLQFDLCDQDETILFRSHLDDGHVDSNPILPGTYHAVATIPGDLLAPMKYAIVVRAVIYNLRNCIPTDGIKVPIQVTADDRMNRIMLSDQVHGRLAPRIAWTQRISGNQ